MHASAAYCVGAGTVVAALAIGLGGGLIAGHVMKPASPRQDSDTSRIERRAEPVTATNARPERVQYLSGSQAFGAVPAQAETRTKAALSETPEQTAAATETGPSEARPAPGEPASSPENANAKATDTDVKHAASERRHAGRRQRWAARRRYEMRDPYGRIDWGDVERNVREDSNSRAFASHPRFGFPQTRWFGPDD